jgi:hypothetical protein
LVHPSAEQDRDLIEKRVRFLALPKTLNGVRWELRTFRVRSFNGSNQSKRLVEAIIPRGDTLFDYYPICPARRHRHTADDRRPIRR